MKRYGVVLDTEKEEFFSRPDNRRLPLKQRGVHLYYFWEANILFTKAEIRKFRCHSHRPKSNVFLFCNWKCRSGESVPGSYQIFRDILFNREFSIDMVSLEENSCFKQWKEILSSMELNYSNAKMLTKRGKLSLLRTFLLISGFLT